MEPFALDIAAVCLVLTLAVLSNRISERLRVPAPAFFLVGAAIASDLVPALNGLSITAVQRIVTVALVVILFDGGMHIGMGRFRRQAGAIVWLGVAGTVLTAAALALIAHGLLGFDWRLSLLLGTALAPTDPAVVFSVLGRREIAGRSGVLLEGESGANDPVGIALLVSILSAGTGGWGAALDGIEVFVLQMGVGAVVGLVGGRLLLAFIRRVPLPSEGLYPLRTLAGAGLVYGIATVAHGSGFLAVFVAGILLGDERAPYKREIERFHASLSSLAEIVAFTLLGLTLQVRSLPEQGIWASGLVMAVLLALVVRPVLVGLVLLPLRLRRRELVFVLWAGLKGAVPVLLGTYLLTSGDPHALRAYEIVFVVVAFSVVVQGGLVPSVAHWVGLPLRVIEPEPWSLGMRFRDEPQGLVRLHVLGGSAADGTCLEELDMGENAWVSLVSRGGQLVQVRGDTVLAAGDEVLLLVEPPDADTVARLFTRPAPAVG
ncbi:MAG TPA: cation:proton antiporter [Kineosporiaceae bacterium]|nr:cation:proton antiporter [Kineosporiaceae bacterium]